MLGGLGSTPGVIAGAFAVGFIPEYLREVGRRRRPARLPQRRHRRRRHDITEYRFFLFGMALVLMMIFRPQASSRAGSGRPNWPRPPARGMGAVAGVDEADVGERRARRTRPPSRCPTDVELPEDYVARAAEVAEEVLVLDDVTMQFGGVAALDDVSLTVHRGQIFGIIGPNGAGKTTVFNCVTGVFQPDRRRHRARGRVARREQAAQASPRPGWPARSRTSGCSRT